MAYERQNICGDLPETTAFKSYAPKHERKSQYANYSHTSGQLSPLDTQRTTRGYPTIVNNIQPCPKRCLLMPLGRVAARTNGTTRYSYDARRGQFPRTRTGTVRKTRLETRCKIAVMRRGFCTLVLFIGSVCVCVCLSVC